MNEKLRNQIISWLNKGKDSHWIANKLKVTWQTVAAVKAHLTMGTY